eukprot:maker-scaffold_12-snap-gene-11.16-mRNA-1 protein AED:0.01 eAED:0.01 QI:182/1/1/1/1/1/2/151/527
MEETKKDKIVVSDAAEPELAAAVKVEVETAQKAVVEASNKAAEKEVPYAERVKCSCFGKDFTERYYILMLFTVINMFLFADQNLLAPNLTVIAEEYNFTDDQRDTYIGGYISLGFFVVGGIVAMIVGLLTDTMNRKLVFAATVVIGEVSCMATYWVPTGTIAEFWYGLWLTRSVTGFAIGGALPIQYSLMGDLFHGAERGKAVAFFSMATSVGSNAGQYVANWLSPDWRTPFLIVSIPTYLLVAIYLVTTKEPTRGGAEDLLQDEDDGTDTGRKGFKVANTGEGSHTIDMAKLKSLLSRPSVALIIFQGLPGCLPWGIIQVFLNDFMKEEKEMSNLEAANAFLAFSVGFFISVIVSGWIQDKGWKYKDGKYRPMLPVFAGVTTLIAPFLLHFVIAYDADGLSPVSYIPLFFVTAFLAGLAGVIVKSTLLLITMPETRGTAFALQSLLDELGKGLGPYIVSVLIQVSPNRQAGMIIGTYGWIPTGFMQIAIAKFLNNDIARNERELLAEYRAEHPEEENARAEVEVSA